MVEYAIECAEFDGTSFRKRFLIKIVKFCAKCFDTALTPGNRCADDMLRLLKVFFIFRKKEMLGFLGLDNV